MSSIYCPRCSAQKEETGKLPKSCKVPGCDNARRGTLLDQRRKKSLKMMKGIVG